jgi:hypothetical protein
MDFLKLLGLGPGLVKGAAKLAKPDVLAGRGPIPQNPLRMNAASPMMPAPAGSTTVNSGLGRAYWPAY